MAYGDWSRSTQMKGHCPTKGVGLRRLIAKRFDTVLIDEFNTSSFVVSAISMGLLLTS